MSKQQGVRSTVWRGRARLGCFSAANSPPPSGLGAACQRQPPYGYMTAWRGSFTVRAVTSRRMMSAPGEGDCRDRARGHVRGWGPGVGTGASRPVRRQGRDGRHGPPSSWLDHQPSQHLDPGEQHGQHRLGQPGVCVRGKSAIRHGHRSVDGPAPVQQPADFALAQLLPDRSRRWRGLHAAAPTSLPVFATARRLCSGTTATPCCRHQPLPPPLPPPAMPSSVSKKGPAFSSTPSHHPQPCSPFPHTCMV